MTAAARKVQRASTLPRVGIARVAKLRVLRLPLLRRSLIALFAVPAVVAAQDTPPSGWGRAPDVNGASSSGTAAWLGAWSPLRPIADIPRGLIRAPMGPGVLDAPAPMSGAFVLSGAPGAIARDLKPRLPGDTSRFGDLRLRVGGESGEFRRPLDISESRVGGGSGFGWAPVGTRGIAIGRFIVDKEKAGVSSFAERVSPYWSSPFVATDSVTPPMERTRARLEGALGLRVGDFGFGVSAGLDTREHNSVDAPLRRTGRASTPAVMTGVEYELPWLAARVGGYYRWSEPNETNTLNANPSATIIYGIQGYDEPFGYIVGANTPVLVRIDRRAHALGGTGELSLFETRVVFTYESGDRYEDQYRSLSRPRPTDQWRASGTDLRLQLQRMFGSGLRATVVGSSESLDGKAYRNDLTGLAFEGSDSKFAVEGDVRWQMGSNWTLAALGGMTRLTTDRVDYVVTLNSSIETVTPFIGGEVARRWGRWGVALGGSTAATTPTGSLPSAEAQGPTYQRLIAPSLAYDASEARAVAAWFTATAPLRKGTLIFSVRGEQTQPLSEVSSRLQPGGDRNGWSMSLGVRP